MSKLLLNKTDDDDKKDDKTTDQDSQEAEGEAAGGQEPQQSQESQDAPENPQESQDQQHQASHQHNHYQNRHDRNQQRQDEEFEGNASIRAKLAYEIAEHLSMEEQKDLDAEAAAHKMNTYISGKAFSSSTELNELQEQEENLVRQNSLRSVFLQYFRSNLYYR